MSSVFIWILEKVVVVVPYEKDLAKHHWQHIRCVGLWFIRYVCMYVIPDLAVQLQLFCISTPLLFTYWSYLKHNL